MSTYQIHPLLVNVIYPKVKAGPRFPQVPDTGYASPIISFLLEGDNGEWILVDTGACGCEWSEKYHHKMSISPEMCWDSVLEPFRIGFQDIKTIVNTHLHWDHCFNNDLFPNAKIYVQKEEVLFAENPIPSHYVFYEAYQMGLTPPWVSSRNRFEIIDGDYHLRDGVDLLLIPGHTKGMQGVLVDTPNGKRFIAGDCIPTMDLWEQREFGMPRPSVIHVDLEAYYRTYQKIIDLNVPVIAGHDYSSLEIK